MNEYVVYRHGWDEQTQDAEHGLPHKMAVARVWAEGPDEACRLAAAGIAVTEGQRLSAEPAEDVDAREDALNRSARTP